MITHRDVLLLSEFPIRIPTSSWTQLASAAQQEETYSSPRGSYGSPARSATRSGARLWATWSSTSSTRAPGAASTNSRMRIYDTASRRLDCCRWRWAVGKRTSPSQPPAIFPDSRVKKLNTRSYSETMAILYSSNEFCLRGSDAVLEFRASLPQQHLAHVRRVAVLWYWNAPPAVATPELRLWQRVWTELARFPALEVLRVEIRTEPEWMAGWMAGEQRLLVSLSSPVSVEVWLVPGRLKRLMRPVNGWLTSILANLRRMRCVLQAPASLSCIFPGCLVTRRCEYPGKRYRRGDGTS